MEKTSQNTLTIRRHFAAPRATVFAAFVDPALLVQWWGPPGYQTPLCEMDVREGGAYRFGMVGDAEQHHVHGEYREIKQSERLVFTFMWEEGDHADLEMVVTLEFHDRNGGTELVLTQEGLPTTASRDDHDGGWSGSFVRLEELVRG